MPLERTVELTAVLTPAEEGGFVALNPETGTTTQGETIEEAVANLQEATTLFLAEFPLASFSRAPRRNDLHRPGACLSFPASLAQRQCGRWSGWGSSSLVRAVVTSSFAEVKSVVSVPLHPELKIGTLAGALRQAQITTEEFMGALR